MTFLIYLIIEGLFLLAAGMTVVAGIRGITGAAIILSILIWLARQENFWVWEIPFLLCVFTAALFLLWLSQKAKQNDFIMGLAGGMTSLVVFGSFLSPFIALIVWALVSGTGLVKLSGKKQIFWGIAPILWRTLLGISWIIFGNVLVN